jgi:hypothetical protein
MSSDTPKEECTDCGAPVDWERELTAEKAHVEALRAALTLYMDAGVGNSTDHELQRAAYQEARAALTKEPK